MTTTVPHTEIDEDFRRWLDAVTRGLPPDLCAAVREEITAHYEDALQDYRARGKSPAEAHRAALADLGDADDTAQGLHDAHLPSLRYVRAMIASAVFPVVYMLLASKAHVTLEKHDIILYAAMLIPTPYLLYTFRALLNEFSLGGRFGFTRANRLIPLICCGLVGLTMPGILSAALRREVVELPNAVDLAQRTFFSPGTLLALVTVAGLLITSIGFILLSDHLIALPFDLYGLLPPVRHALLITGVGLLSMTIGGLLHVAPFVLLMQVLTLFGFILLNVLWLLLFFRAAYRSAARPTQTA
jgi:hypothetical protein